MSDRQKMGDIILIIGCLVTAFLLGIFFALHRTAGSMLYLSCDGMVLKRVDLNQIDSNGQIQYYLIKYTGENVHEKKIAGIRAEDATEAEVIYYDYAPELPEKESYNLISITDGKVTMEAADCRDQICVHHKPIMSERESIICLPHKLVIEISGSGSKSGADRQQRTDTNDELLDGVAR